MWSISHKEHLAQGVSRNHIKGTWSAFCSIISSLSFSRFLALKQLILPSVKDSVSCSWCCSMLLRICGQACFIDLGMQARAMSMIRKCSHCFQTSTANYWKLTVGQEIQQKLENARKSKEGETLLWVSVLALFLGFPPKKRLFTSSRYSDLCLDHKFPRIKTKLEPVPFPCFLPLYTYMCLFLLFQFYNYVASCTSL